MPPNTYTTQRNENMRPIVMRGVVLALLLVAALCVRPIVLQGARPVNLPDAPPLAGQVSQAFAVGSSKNLPVMGKDYSVQNIHYFDSHTWLVANIKSLSTDGSDGIIVMQQEGGIYLPMLGPGSAFADTQIISLPADVAAYLTGLGAVDESL